MVSVSVIIPVYNGAAFIEAAIQSVIDQSVKDLEIIVVNDGSTDNTAELVQRFDDPRLRRVNQTNCGLAAARNRGIEVANGTYIAFLDADDRWLPTKLARQIEILERRPEVGLVYGGYELIDAFGTRLTKRQPRAIPEPALRSLVRSNLVAGSATTSIVRRVVLDEVGGFDEMLPAGEDWDLWIRITRCSDLAFVPETVAQIRLHNLNMTSQATRMERGLLAVVDKAFATEPLPAELHGHYNRARAGALFQSAIFYERSGERRCATTRLLRAIRRDPRNLDQYIVLCRLLCRFDPIRLSETVRSTRRRLRMQVERGT
jgi:glycosyltransferase involved in cell wall biosynthesis